MIATYLDFGRQQLKATFLSSKRLAQTCVLCVMTIASQAISLNLVRADFDWEKLVIQGNEKYTQGAIRLGLMMEPSLNSELSKFNVADPERVAEMGRRIAQEIEQTYQGNGFVDAKVSVDDEPKNDGEKNGVIYLTIEEGPEFHCSEIEIVGLSEAHSKQLKQLLYQDEPKPNQESITSIDGSKMLSRKIGSKELVGEKGDDAPLSKKKKHIDETFLAGVNLRVRRTLARMGFPKSECITTTTLDRSSAIQRLHIDVRDLGPQTLLHEVRFEGLNRHDEPMLCESLGLKIGEPWSEAESLRVQTQLYESGRFQFHCVSALPPWIDPLQTILVIQVIESPDLPLLYEPLSEDQENLRRFAVQFGKEVYARGGASLNKNSDIHQPKQLVSLLLTPDTSLVRFGDFLEPIEELEFRIVGQNELSSDSSEKKYSHKVQFAFFSSEDNQIKTMVMIAPFVLLSQGGEHRKGADGSTVWESQRTEIRFTRDESGRSNWSSIHLKGYADEDEQNLLDIQLERMTQVEWQKENEHWLSKKPKNAFVFRNVAEEIKSCFNESSSKLGVFVPGSLKTEGGPKVYGLFVASVCEKLFGCESVQYRLARESLLQETQIGSTFENSISNILDSDELGPITLMTACLLTQSAKPYQCDVFSRHAIKRFNEETIRREISKLIACNETVSKLLKVLPQLADALPDDYIEIVKAFEAPTSFFELAIDQFRSDNVDPIAVTVELAVKFCMENRQAFENTLWQFNHSSALIRTARDQTLDAKSKLEAQKKESENKPANKPVGTPALEQLNFSFPK